MGMTLAVASGKGGVGKTQTAINLGAALSLNGRKAIVVDGNMPTPDVSLYLGIQAPKTLNDVLAGKAVVEEAVYKHETGLHVLPASVRLKDINGFGEKAFGALVKKLKHSYEMVFIDCPPGLEAGVINIVRHADKILLVSTPEFVSLADAYKTAALSEAAGKEVRGVILNRTGRFRGEVKGGEIGVLLDKHPVIGRVPEDASVPIGAVNSNPVVTAFPHSPAARAFKRIAANLVGEEYGENAFVETALHFLNHK